MAQTIKLKRSATQGASPTTSQLELGEVAINTYDGKMYIKKNVGGTESIVEVGAGGGSGGGLSSSFTLYEYTATANQTTFSGSDSNSNTLAYDTGTPPKILVYLNGVLLDHTTDYTATNGTSVVLTSGAAASDLVQVAAYKSESSVALDIDLADNVKLKLGDDDDLQIYHDGSNSYIKDTGTGSLAIQASQLNIDSSNGSEYQATFVENGAVSLYYDGSKKVETTSSGIQVQGAMASTTGTYSPIYYGGSSSLQLKSNTGELFGQFTNNGAAELYYDNTKKFETTSTGATITGNIAVTGTVDGRDLATDGAKLDNIESNADVTDTTNVTAAGALMDSEVTNLAQVKAFDSSDYATAAQGSTADSAMQDLVDDTTPQLGGNLDLNSNNITGTGNVNITGTISSGAITSSGNISGAALIIDSATAVDKTSHYMVFYDGSGAPALYAGNTSDNRNYYQSNHHRFRSDDANTNFAEISSVGMIIGAEGPETNMGMLHVKDSDSSVANAYQNGNGGITIERNGRAALNFLTPNTQDAYVFWGDPETANIAYIGYAHSTDQAVWKSDGTFRLQGGRVDIDEELRIKHSSTVLDITGDASTNTYFASTGEIRVRPNGTTINKIVLNSSYINAPAYQVGGTEVIDSSGNISSGNITTTGYLRGPSTFTIDPATHGDDTGTVVIAGNLQVDGTTTTINSTTLTVDDKNITLASGSTNAAAANGAGLTVDCGSDTDATFTYDGTDDEWDFNKNINVTGAVVSSANGAITTASGTTARFSVSETSGATTAMDARGSTGNICTRSNHTLGFLVNDVQKATLTANGDFTVTNDLKLTTTNPRIDYDGGNSGALRFYSTSAAQERMRITSGGNVGIGTTTPDEFSIGSTFKYLAVGGDKPGIINLVDDSTNGSFLQFGTAAGVRRASVHAENSSDLVFTLNSSNTGTSLAERVRIKASNGNVGIGTSSPGQKLDVRDGTITSRDATNTNYAELDRFVGLTLKGNGAGTRTVQTPNSDALTFGTNNTERMRITSTGRVRINNNNSSWDSLGTLLVKQASNNVGIGIVDQNSTNTFQIRNNGTYSELYYNVNNPIVFSQSGGERMRIDSSGNVGIGVTTPFTVGGTAKLSLSTSTNVYLTAGASNSDLIYSRRLSSGHYQTQTYLNNNTGSLELQPYGGKVGIGTNGTVSATFQVEEAGIDTTTTTTTATTQVAIDTFAAATFRSARYTIQVTNSTDSTYHLTEVLLIHDGTTPQITEYGTIFTGSAEATFDADISSGNVRLLATPATTDSMTFKVVRHCITV